MEHSHHPLTNGPYGQVNTPSKVLAARYAPEYLPFVIGNRIYVSNSVTLGDENM